MNRSERTILIEKELTSQYKNKVLPYGLLTSLAKKHCYTRQRIEQLLTRLYPDRFKQGDNVFKHPCPACLKLKPKSNKFCNRDHYLEHHLATWEQVKCKKCSLRPSLSLGMCERCYQQYRYHDVKGVRERHVLHMKRYMAKPGVKAKMKKRHEQYLERTKYNQRTYVIAKRREKYLKLKNDPVAWAKLLKKHSEYSKKVYWERKNNV